MFDHPVILLSFATFALVIGFAIWNLITVRRQQKGGGEPKSGIGGPNDPLS